MPSVTQHVLPKLHSLPTTLPLEGAVRIELEEGVPIFRASETVQTRIDTLLSTVTLILSDSASGRSC